MHFCFSQKQVLLLLLLLLKFRNSLTMSGVKKLLELSPKFLSFFLHER